MRRGSAYVQGARLYALLPSSRANAVCAAHVAENIGIHLRCAQRNLMAMMRAGLARRHYAGKGDAAARWWRA